MRELVVELPLCPPRRLGASLRWRSFKTNPDRLVWESAWSRVEARQEEGWRVERVVVDWGKNLPLATHEQRLRFIRDMTDCETVDYDVSKQGKGRTMVYLSRVANEND